MRRGVVPRSPRHCQQRSGACSERAPNAKLLAAARLFRDWCRGDPKQPHATGRVLHPGTHAMVARGDDGHASHACRLSVPPGTQSMQEQGDRPHRKWTLVAAILGLSVTTLDQTVVFIAVPEIERELQIGLAGQQWVVNAYLLGLAAFILLGGSLADIFGRRRVFLL